MNPFSELPSLTLLPAGAVFLRESETLVVADVHLGKSACFRAQGLPIPEGDNARDFERLSDLVKQQNASQLVVAGDLFHAAAGLTTKLISTLDDFLQTLGIPVCLVLGNPVVKIPDGLRTSLRMPCFLFRENALVLPAFGSFTGGAIVTAAPSDRIFTALRDQVVELPPALFTRESSSKKCRVPN